MCKIYLGVKGHQSPPFRTTAARQYYIGKDIAITLSAIETNVYLMEGVFDKLSNGYGSTSISR